MLFQKNDRVLFYGDSVTDADRSKPTGQGIAVFNFCDKHNRNILLALHAHFRLHIQSLLF